jgi:hypothetical protein
MIANIKETRRSEVAYPVWRDEGAPFAPDGYVYVLRWAPCDCHPPLYKVGRARYSDKRIVRLRIQLPFEVDVLYQIPCEDHRRVERDLHDWLWEYCKRGEWFAIPERHEVWDLFAAGAADGGLVPHDSDFRHVTASGAIACVVPYWWAEVRRRRKLYPVKEYAVVPIEFMGEETGWALVVDEHDNVLDCVGVSPEASPEFIEEPSEEPA